VEEGLALERGEAMGALAHLVDVEEEEETADSTIIIFN